MNYLVAVGFNLRHIYGRMRSTIGPQRLGMTAQTRSFSAEGEQDLATQDGMMNQRRKRETIRVEITV